MWGWIDVSGKELGDFINMFYFKDAEMGGGFMYFSDTGNICSRIDLCFVSREWSIETFTIQREPLTDHGRFDCVVRISGGGLYGKNMWN